MIPLYETRGEIRGEYAMFDLLKSQVEGTTLTSRSHRDISIDIAKGIGILLMVIGHLKIPIELHQFIYMFHMPLFFVISGYLFQPDKWIHTFSKFLSKRINRLIIPYFSMSVLILYPLWFFAGRHFGESAGLEKDPLNTFIDIFLGMNFDYYIPIWFLPCLFVTEIIFQRIYMAAKSGLYLLMCACTISIVGYILHICNIKLLWCIDIAMVVQVFFIFGYLLSHQNIKLTIKHTIIASIILIILSGYNITIDTAQRQYDNLLYYYLGGISGSILILWISQRLSNNSFASRLLGRCGRESMTILLWHGWGIKTTSVFLVYILHISLQEAQRNLWGAYVVSAVGISFIILYCKNIIHEKLLERGYSNLVKILNW